MQYKSSFVAILLVLATVLPAHAEKWFEYSHEDGTVGNDLPDSGTPNPYDIADYSLGETAKYASDAIRSKYGEQIGWEATNPPCNANCVESPTTDDCQCSHALVIGNPSGTYGTAFSAGSPVTLVAGTTYYLGGFFRFERIGGLDIFDQYNDFHKGLEMKNENTSPGWRWVVNFGCADVVTFHSGYWTATAWAGQSSNPTWKAEHYEHVTPNQNGYSYENPYLCQYEKWYAIVLGVTAYNNTNGRVRLWINGTLTTDLTGTTMESTGQAIKYLEIFGSIGQTDYDTPQHKRQFDNVILTDSWSDITAAGLDQDPEISSTTNNLIGGTLAGGTLQ